jgi:hypothetical protein
MEGKISHACREGGFAEGSDSSDSDVHDECFLPSKNPNQRDQFHYGEILVEF